MTIAACERVRRRVVARGTVAALAADMTNHARKRLQLNTETLQRIDAASLAEALGGVQAPSGGTCAGFTCALTARCTIMANCGGFARRP